MFETTSPRGRKTTYTGAITHNGSFLKFERKVGEVDLEFGHWAFNTAHEIQAYERGVNDPESLLLAHLALETSPGTENIELIWMPGKRDKFCVPRRGTALQHVTAIIEERDSLGLKELPPDAVPFYPHDPSHQLLELRQQNKSALSVASNSCGHCRQRRRQCTKAIPICERCEQGGHACVYPPNSRTAELSFGSDFDKAPRRREKIPVTSEDTNGPTYQPSSTATKSNTAAPLALKRKQGPAQPTSRKRQKTATVKDKPPELLGQDAEPQGPSCSTSAFQSATPGIMSQCSGSSSHQNVPSGVKPLSPNNGYYHLHNESGRGTNYKPPYTSSFPPESAFSSPSVSPQRRSPEGNRRPAYNYSFPPRPVFSTSFFQHSQDLSEQMRSLLERRSLPTHNLPVVSELSQPRNRQIDLQQPAPSSGPICQDTETSKDPFRIELDKWNASHSTRNGAANMATGVTMEDDGDVTMLDSGILTVEEPQDIDIITIDEPQHNKTTVQINDTTMVDRPRIECTTVVKEPQNKGITVAKGPQTKETRTVEKPQGGKQDCIRHNAGTVLMGTQSRVVNGTTQPQTKPVRHGTDNAIIGRAQSTVEKAVETRGWKEIFDEPLNWDFVSEADRKEMVRLSREVSKTLLPCMECGMEDGHDYGCGIGSMAQNPSARENPNLLDPWYGQQAPPEPSEHTRDL